MLLVRSASFAVVVRSAWPLPCSMPCASRVRVAKRKLMLVGMRGMHPLPCPMLCIGASSRMAQHAALLDRSRNLAVGMRSALPLS